MEKKEDAMALTTGSGDLKTRAPDFTLPGVDGRDWSLAEVAGKNGTVVAFICNHCPYVVHLKTALADFGREFGERAGVWF